MALDAGGSGGSTGSSGGKGSDLMKYFNMSSGGKDEDEDKPTVTYKGNLVRGAGNSLSATKK
jgi:hypothetical protein